jgi:hypothetical protein
MTGPNVPVPQPVYTAAKAVAATVTTAAGVVTLFVTDIADGSLSWDEGGTLIGAVVTAVVTIGAVWGTRNNRKPLQ